MGVDLNGSFKGLLLIMFIFLCIYAYMKYSKMSIEDRYND